MISLFGRGFDSRQLHNLFTKGSDKCNATWKNELPQPIVGCGNLLL